LGRAAPLAAGPKKMKQKLLTVLRCGQCSVALSFQI
jgi:hypothetical protein